MKPHSVLLIVVLVLSVRLNKGLQLSPSLVENYFDSENVKSGIVFHCQAISSSFWMQISRRFFMSYHTTDKLKRRNSWKFENRQLGVVFDATCENSAESLDMIAEHLRFNISNKWLIISDGLEKAEKLLKSRSINIDSEVTLAVAEKEENFLLFDIFAVNFNFFAVPKGSWSARRKSIELYKNQSKFDQRSDLRGTSIMAGVVATHVGQHQTLLQYMKEEVNVLNDAQHRHSFKLFQVLSERFNFSLNLLRAPLWGILRNETYDGVLGMFQKQQIDLSVTPFRFTSDRIDLFDFTVVTWVTTPTIVFRHPRSTNRNIFLQPFATGIWFAILGVFLLLSTLLLISVRLQPKESKTFSFPRTLVVFVGILCQQGIIDDLKKSSTRIFLYTAILSSLLIYQFYSSFIVSSVLTDPPKTINNLRQLIDSKLKVGIEDITYNADFFQTTTDQLALELYQKKVKSPKNFFEINKGLDLMQQGGFAFHVDTSYAYMLIGEKFSDEELGDLHEILLFPIRPLAPSVAKKSPYREFIMIGLQRLIESGIVNFHTRRMSSEKPKLLKSSFRMKTLELEQTIEIFWLLGGAIATSFVILMIENCHHKFYCRKN